MNQKLRATRGVIMVLFAILCIVSLSLSLLFSSHFAAYADESDAATILPDVSPVDGSHLWLVHYEGGPADGEPLWDGIHNDKAIHYLDSNDSLKDGFGICVGTDKEKDFFAPYRGVELSVKLNPQYKIDADTTLGDKYDLSDTNVEYSGNTDVLGNLGFSINATTTATVGGDEPLELTKNWKIAALCNTVDIEGSYIEHERSYAQAAAYADVTSELPADIVYHFHSSTVDTIVAVRHEANGISYFCASESGGDYEVSNEPYMLENVSNEVLTNEGGLINYLIRTLDVDAYTLKIAAMSPDVGVDGIIYATGINTYEFKVTAQDISDATTFEQLFGTPVIADDDKVIIYTGDTTWSPKVQLKRDNIVLRQGIDYNVSIISCDVGWVDMQIIGNGNLVGQLTISNAIRILPTDNEWNELPNIYPWNYGDYKADFNVIVGMPKFGEIEDITFRIVKVDEDGDDVALDGLGEIHYIRKEGSDDLTVTSAVSAALSKLEVGQYRLYASVSGADSSNSNKNYNPLEEKSVTFHISMGSNNWGEDSVPTIVSWTAGKYNPDVNTITAVDRFGNEAIVIIRNGKGVIVYSSSPDHSEQEFGGYGKDADEIASIFKKLKAGYYTLQAEVVGTNNYNGLKTLIDFSIARNGLPAWAVALIIIGSLGIVALVFGLLHQKGVLQMLTGKVIVSMRTRANVDATLAAIRAAKVAREAEASIAAAKARDAEEAAKAKENNEDKQ